MNDKEVVQEMRNGGHVISWLLTDKLGIYIQGTSNRSQPVCLYVCSNSAYNSEQ